MELYTENGPSIAAYLFREYYGFRGKDITAAKSDSK